MLWAGTRKRTGGIGNEASVKGDNERAEGTDASARVLPHLRHAD